MDYKWKLANKIKNDGKKKKYKYTHQKLKRNKRNSLCQNVKKIKQHWPATLKFKYRTDSVRFSNYVTRIGALGFCLWARAATVLRSEVLAENNFRITYVVATSLRGLACHARFERDVRTFLIVNSCLEIWSFRWSKYSMTWLQHEGIWSYDHTTFREKT